MNCILKTIVSEWIDMWCFRGGNFTLIAKIELIQQIGLGIECYKVNQVKVWLKLG